MPFTPSPVRSYGVEVRWSRDDHEAIWTGDAIRFETPEEADGYGTYRMRTTVDILTYRICFSGWAPNALWMGSELRVVYR